MNHINIKPIQDNTKKLYRCQDENSDYKTMQGKAFELLRLGQSLTRKKTKLFNNMALLKSTYLAIENISQR